MKNFRQKPLPEESIYKHLRMLCNYCADRAAHDGVEERRKAFLWMSQQLDWLSNSRASVKLQSYGE